MQVLKAYGKFSKKVMDLHLSIFNTNFTLTELDLSRLHLLYCHIFSVVNPEIAERSTAIL